MAIDCQHSWYRRPPPSGALSPSNPEDSVPPQWNVLLKPLRLRIQVLFKMTLPILRASLALLMYGFWTQKVPLSPRILLLLNRLQRLRLQLVFLSSLSGDQPSPTPASAVPSVSDSVLGQIPSMPEDPVPSLTDSALAEVDMPPASRDPVPSVSDSVLAQVDVPSPCDVPALDLTQPDENSDDDEMGDSVAPLEAEELATAWKRVSCKKGQRRKNLARKATNSHSFAPVREATRPNPPGVRPNRGKDPPE